MRLLRALLCQVLKTFCFGDCLDFLGNLLQCLISLLEMDFIIYIQLKSQLFKFIPVIPQPSTMLF